MGIDAMLMDPARQFALTRGMHTKPADAQKLHKLERDQISMK